MRLESGKNFTRKAVYRIIPTTIGCRMPLKSDFSQTEFYRSIEADISKIEMPCALPFSEIFGVKMVNAPKIFTKFYRLLM